MCGDMLYPLIEGTEDNKEISEGSRSQGSERSLRLTRARPSFCLGFLTVYHQ
jgi:hypothetical protein